MNRTLKRLLLALFLIKGLLFLSGCSSLMEEDPNDASLPWATPADWEGTVPGMPGPGSR